MGDKARDNAQEVLDRIGVIVRNVFDKGIERVSNSRLADKLKRGAAHPREDIDRFRTAIDPGRDRGDELRTIMSARREDPVKASQAYIARDHIECGRHVPEVICGEDGCEHLALLAVHIGVHGQQAGPQ